MLNFSTEIGSALLRLDNRFRLLATIQFGVNLFLLFLVAIGLAFGMSLQGLIIVQVLGAMFRTLLYLWFGWSSSLSLKLSGWWRVSLHTLDGYWRKILWFLLGTNLLSSTQLVARQLDVLLLGWLGSAEQVGVYGIARRITREMSTIMMQLLRAMQPEIAKMVAAKQYMAIWQFVTSSSILLFAVSLIAGIGLNVAAYLFIPIFFGAEFADAVPLALVMLWTIVSMTTLWYRPVMLALGRPMLLWGSRLLTTGIFVGFLFLLVPAYESMGVAVATLLYSLSNTILGGAIGFWALRRWRSEVTDSRVES